ncbi:MAG: DUF1919 domain-containing protein [Flavobacteriaceae bacterium]|nr:DUF1919 domain-containing protein [Flavobacteriaceae bacterium]
MVGILHKSNVFVQRKYRSLFKKRISKQDIELLKDTNFIIIANNCWGGAIYQWLTRSYNTPFIGLFINDTCYLKLLSNFDFYMKQELQFITKSKYASNGEQYPIGLLDDIEIHFLHYKSTEEAEEKWVRRTERMLEEKDEDRYFFKFSSSSQEETIYKKFHSLKFKNKISFHINNDCKIQSSAHLRVFEREKDKIVNGVKLFKLSFLYVDIFHWLRHNEIRK